MIKIRAYENQAYNLPVDTIYYIEQGNKKLLNRLVYINRNRIEKIINSIENRLFDYKFEYISLNTLSDIKIHALLKLKFPDKNDTEIDAIWANNKSKMAGFKHNGENNLCARIIPFGDEDDFKLLETNISIGKFLKKTADFARRLNEENKYSIERTNRINRHLDNKHNIEDSSIRFQVVPRCKGNSKAKKSLFPDFSTAIESEDSITRSCNSPRMDMIPEEESLREKAIRIRNEITDMQRNNGINILVEVLGDEFLKSLKKLSKSQPSRILVTEDFEITLPDYNLVIKMNSLSKSLYFLFLIFPDGVRMKELDRYKSLLWELYKLVSNREDSKKMAESIDELTNPLSNSANEKMSRIRAAFYNVLASDIAQEYVPYGIRGEKRHIALNQSLIHIPDLLLNIKDQL